MGWGKFIGTAGLFGAYHIWIVTQKFEKIDSTIQHVKKV